MDNRYLGLACDLILICLFALGLIAVSPLPVTAGTVAAAAWPYLAGCLAGWLITRIWMRRWRIIKSGLIIWADTWLLAMLFKLLFDTGQPNGYALVSLISLLVLLLGWRLLWWQLRGKALYALRSQQRRRRAEAAVEQMASSSPESE